MRTRAGSFRKTTMTQPCGSRPCGRPGGVCARRSPASPSSIRTGGPEGSMRDPRPVFCLLILQMLFLLTLVGWWCNLTPLERLAHLGAVMSDEHIPTVPPAGLWAQAMWLYTHRLARLQGMAGLGVVAVLAGLGEGIARRRQ